MDAMILGYPPEDKGKISVTATKKEWHQIITDLVDTYGQRTEESDRLIHQLVDQGVYE